MHSTDYTAVNQTLQFESSGLAEECVNISIITDSLVEEQEYLLVSLVSNDPRVIVNAPNASIFIDDSSSKIYVLTLRLY